VFRSKLLRRRKRRSSLDFFKRLEFASLRCRRALFRMKLRLLTKVSSRVGDVNRKTVRSHGLRFLTGPLRVSRAIGQPLTFLGGQLADLLHATAISGSSSLSSRNRNPRPYRLSPQRGDGL
jgi:hypothetical protein